MCDILDRNIGKLMLAEIEHSFEILRALKIDVDKICIRHLNRKYSEIGLELSNLEIAEIYFKVRNINEISVNELKETDSNFLAYIESEQFFKLVAEKEMQELNEKYITYGYGVGSIGTAEEGGEVGDLSCSKCNKFFMIDDDCYRISDDSIYLCEGCHANRFKTSRSWDEYILLDERIKLNEYVVEELKNASDEVISIFCTILMEQNSNNLEGDFLNKSIILNDYAIQELKKESDEIISLLCSLVMAQTETIAYYTTAW